MKRLRRTSSTRALRAHAATESAERRRQARRWISTKYILYYFASLLLQTVDFLSDIAATVAYFGLLGVGGEEGQFSVPSLYYFSPTAGDDAASISLITEIDSAAKRAAVVTFNAGALRPGENTTTLHLDWDSTEILLR